jgi:hypothetical protein
MLPLLFLVIAINYEIPDISVLNIAQRILLGQDRDQNRPLGEMSSPSH